MQITPPNLQFSDFSTQWLPAPVKFDAWKESINFMYDVDTVEENRRLFKDASVESILIDDVLLTRTRAGCQKIDRTQLKIESDGMDHYVLQFLKRGKAEFYLGRKTLVASTEVLAGSDLADTLDSWSSEFDLFALIIPRHKLNRYLDAPYSVQGSLMPYADNAPARLFSNYVETLYRIAHCLNSEQASTAVQSAIQLGAAALNGYFNDSYACKSSIHYSQLLKAKAVIETLLPDPKLNPKQIADKMHMSRAALYRLFEPYGGISAYIRERRVHRALQDTLHRRDLSMTDIAYRWGFSELSSLSRSFKQTLSVTPSDLRAGLSGAAMGEQASRLDISDQDYERWLLSLAR